MPPVPAPPQAKDQLRKGLQTGTASSMGSLSGDGDYTEDDDHSSTWMNMQIKGLKYIFVDIVNILLIFVPFGIYSGQNDWGARYTFTFNFLGIVPLARVICGATEALAARTGQMLGGLVTASFGNVVEMMIIIHALRAGLVEVIQGSLIGSILCNLLLVLGLAFVASGFYAKQVTFNLAGAGTHLTVLVVACLGLSLPTVFTYVPNTNPADLLVASRMCSCVMAGVYCLFLVFQLVTHYEIFAGEEEEHDSSLSGGVAVIILCTATCVAAVCSHHLVGSIEGVSQDYGLTKSFIGVILVPLVCNAAEHMSAVTVAAKGKMDLSIGVAVGSASQVALLLVPFAVIVGWRLDVPMVLDFHIFTAAAFVLSVFLAGSILYDGSTNWFEGMMLLATWGLVAIITWFTPDAAIIADGAGRQLTEGIAAGVLSVTV